MKGRKYALVLFGIVLVLFAGIAAASDPGEAAEADNIIYHWGEWKQNPLYGEAQTYFCEAPVFLAEGCLVACADGV